MEFGKTKDNLYRLRNFFIVVFLVIVVTIIFVFCFNNGGVNDVPAIGSNISENTSDSETEQDESLSQLQSVEGFTFDGDIITGYTGNNTEIVVPSSYSIDEFDNPCIGDDYLLNRIGDSAFYNNGNLTNVTLQDGITCIGSYAFNGCVRLISVIMPDSVTSIGAYAFKDCIHLKSITIPNGITSLENGLFRHCSTLNSAILPSSLTIIGHEVFEFCYNLTGIIIPESVVSIGNYAFYECRNLISITIPSKITSIERGTFQSCIRLETVTFESNSKLLSIVDYAFADTRLTSIVLPSEVNHIGDKAIPTSAYYSYYWKRS